MNAVVVTGFVKIPNPRGYDEYERLGARLGEICAAPVLPFRCDITECWLYPHVSGVACKHMVGDNPAKNTLAYHVVQHQKTKWLLEAMESEPTAEVFVWIDYGIFHQPGITADIINAFLRRVRVEPEISIPGAWGESTLAVDAWPDWRFCGSSLVVPRNWVRPFHEAVRHVTLERLHHDNRVTWEINDWAEVERRRLGIPIRWYKADHNQTQFTNY